MNVRELPIDRVFPNPGQPRKEFADDALRELAASIATSGLLQPIRVRGEGKRGYKIICGERRWRAHKLLGRETVPAIVVVGVSNEELADAALIENMQRKDISPLEEARAFQARLDSGIAVEDLARRLGMKQPWRISERVALLKLTPIHQDALARGILTTSQAQEMTRLPPASQAVLFDAIGSGRCRTYEELRRVSAALLDAEKQTSFLPTEEPTRDRDVAAARALERRVEQLCSLAFGDVTEAEVEALARVLPLKVEGLATVLEAAERALHKLRLTLHVRVIAQEARLGARPGAQPCARATNAS